MIACRIMDETCLLPACLHRGAIPLASLRDVMATPTEVEKQEGIEAGTLARFLQVLCRQYGSCAVLAIDDDTVVGKLRFAPAQVERMLSGICLQQVAQVRAIAALDLATLPARDALERQMLRLDCYQVAEGYHGRGIAKQMLDTAIEWARANRWDALTSSAIRHIPPLLNWSGQASLRALQERGFIVVNEEVHPALREGVVSQRGGHHGEEVTQQWRAFADISDDVAATLYELELDL